MLIKSESSPSVPWIRDIQVREIMANSLIYGCLPPVTSWHTPQAGLDIWHIGKYTLEEQMA